MTATIRLELVTPEALVFSNNVEMAVIPGVEGEFGVLQGHAPMISLMKPGVVRITDADGRPNGPRIFVSSGFADVTAERCTILAEEAVLLETASLADAQKRIEDAKAALRHPADDAEKHKAEVALSVATALVDALTDDKAA